MSGRAADLVQWTIEAYNDLQRDRDGKWKWLLGNFSLSTTANDIDYAYTECTDTDASAAISRFRAWELNKNLPPLIYLTDDGQSTEQELRVQDWYTFRYNYRRGTHTAAYPGDVSADPANVLFLGPTPDDAYTVTGNYWKSNQVLADDDDTPEMPTDYHMLIVYRAMLKYAYNIVAHEILARVSAEGEPLYEALTLNQSWSRYTIMKAGALA